MNKFKVLHFPLHDPYGGITRYVLEHWRCINQEVFQFDLITRFAPDQAFYASAGENARVIPLCGAVQGNEAQFFQRISDIMDQGYDAVHLHTSNWYGGFPLEQMAMGKKIPRVIVHSHGSGMDLTKKGLNETELRQRHEDYKKKFTDALATDCIACSGIAADWLFGPQIPRDKIKIFANAIDTAQFRFSSQLRDQTRRELGVENRLVVGFVGRIDPVKNPFFVIDIFAQTCRIRPDACLLWAGSGTLEAEVRAYAQETGLDIRFLGLRDDILALMHAFDCLLLPSLSEGLPLVLVEAQACGLPCLASTNVTPEVKATDMLARLSLQETAQTWAAKLIAMTFQTKRCDYSEKVAAEGYDIYEQVKKLEHFYLGENS